MGMLLNLRGLEKMFFFIDKLFSKIYSHFLIVAIFGEYRLIFFATFERSKFVGLLFNLWGLEKMFSIIEKLFSKVAISQFQPFSVNLGLIFLRLLQENLWGYLTYGITEMFSSTEKVFQNL